MSTTIRIYTKNEITSLRKVVDKQEKDYNRASIEASYAKKMLHWHKRNLYDAQMDEEKIDTIIDLKEKVNKQEDIYNKWYAEWSDLLDIYTKEVNSYNDVMNDYKKQPDYEDPDYEKEDHEDSDYDCSFCGKNARECGEDHDDEMRETEYARRRDVWL